MESHQNNVSIKKEVPKRLGLKECKILSLSALGGILEFYDFVIFVFYAKIISTLFFPPGDEFWALMATLGLFAAGYFARPLGGIIMAHYGDKLGRKKIFTLSIFIMAVPTLVIGGLPTYETIGIAAPLILLLMRITQGIAIGGEMPGAWVFVAEHTPRSHYGLGIGILTSGLVGGILLGSIVAMTLSHQFTESELHDFAWRIPFILGGVFGLISVYLRRFLEETPVFQEMVKERSLTQELPIQEVLKEHKKACVITALLTWVLSTIIVTLVLMTPDIILQGLYGIPRDMALEANGMAVFAVIIGCIFWGKMSDSIGTHMSMLIGYVGLGLSVLYFYGSLTSDISLGTLMLNYSVAGFFAGIITSTAIVSTRSFPPAIRFSGLSFSYNMSYAIFGGLTPIIIGMLLPVSPLAPAYYIVILCLLAAILGFIPLAYQGFKKKIVTHDGVMAELKE